MIHHVDSSEHNNIHSLGKSLKSVQMEVTTKYVILSNTDRKWERAVA